MQWQKRLLSPRFRTSAPPSRPWLSWLKYGAWRLWLLSVGSSICAPQRRRRYRYRFPGKPTHRGCLRDAAGDGHVQRLADCGRAEAPDGGVEDSSWRSSSNWEWIFHKHGNPLSWKQIVREIDAGRLTRAPGGNTRRVGLGMVVFFRPIPRIRRQRPANENIAKENPKTIEVDTKETQVANPPKRPPKLLKGLFSFVFLNYENRLQTD